MKIAICAICRLENNYIREWVDYYKTLGIDHIFLYDNNDLNGERLIDILSQDVNDGFVSIAEVFGREGLNKRGCQVGIYNECFNSHKSEYDWFGFFDIDEFVYLPEMTLKEFLSNKMFDDTDVIHLSWQLYGDNGHCFYEDKPVLERFTKPCPKDCYYAQKFPENKWTKSFVKCTNKNIKIYTHTTVVQNGICRTATGRLTNCELMQETEICWENCYVKHFITKSLQEHIERRILFLANVFNNDLTTIDLQLKCYFNINEHDEYKDALVNFIKKKLNY